MKANKLQLARSNKRKQDREVELVYVYKFPNGMVCVFDTNENQVPELQGKYTPQLWERIRKRASANTVFKT